MKTTVKTIKVLKYIPKIWSTLCYLVFIIFAMVLFFSRKIEAFRFEFLLNIFPEFQLHISNFSISLLIVITSGYTAGFQQKSIVKIFFIACAVILINLIYELFLPFINTKDILDAYYGIAGTLFSFIFLLPYYLVGRKENPLYGETNGSSPIN